MNSARIEALESDGKKTFDHHHPSSPMTLVGDLTVVAVERAKGYVEKGYDKTVNLITRKKAPQGQAVVDYDVGFRKREIRTAANCYRIDERGDFGKCP